MSVTINATGPVGSQVSIAFPSFDSLSPCQMTRIRRGWDSSGSGRWWTTISSKTSESGLFFARYFISPERHFSYTSLNETPLFFMNGADTAQLYSAEPNATVPCAASSFQPLLYASSFIPLISLLTLSITFPRRICISISSTFSSLMSRSTLLMKRTGRTCSLSAWRSTVSVWGIVPSTASTSTTAPSTARIARVTSPPKSTWPGVSIMLMRYSCPSYSWTIETFDASMVMPRDCSSSSESMKSCLPASSSEIMPAPASRLSDRVVLPWSICATIPMFRICFGSFMSSVARSMLFLPRDMK